MPSSWSVSVHVKTASYTNEKGFLGNPRLFSSVAQPDKSTTAAFKLSAAMVFHMGAFIQHADGF